MSNGKITMFLLLLTAIGFGSMLDAHALEMYDYKAAAEVNVIDDVKLNTLWKSSTPVCIKESSSLCGVNKAFAANGMKYQHCSGSAKNLRKLKAMGLTVVKIDISSLSDKAQRAVRQNSINGKCKLGK